jgi:threonine dehydratase
MSFLPTLAEVDSASKDVYAAIPPTPQFRWPLLCNQLGTDIWLKHENHSPVGAFKARGGLVYFSDLGRNAAPAGVITATRGNHGQSIGLAAAGINIAATVVVPIGNSIEKNAAMRALEVELIEHGDDFQEAREYAELLASERHLHMVPSFHPLLIRGVATYAAELFRAVVNIDVAYVPVGLGSGICGMISVRDGIGAKTEIVGVVSSHARAYAASFSTRSVVESPATTILGDGMACRTPEPEALDIMYRGVDRIVEVTDDELAHSMRIIYECTHNVSEGAGAAAVAAAFKEGPKIRGKKVAAILTGGNIDKELFASVLDSTFEYPRLAQSA